MKQNQRNRGGGNRFIVSLIVITFMVVLGFSLYDPDATLYLLIGLVVGVCLGMAVNDSMVNKYRTRGFEEASSIMREAISNPATLMREMRLDEKEQYKRGQQQDNGDTGGGGVTIVPNIEMTGFDQ